MANEVGSLSVEAFLERVSVFVELERSAFDAETLLCPYQVAETSSVICTSARKLTVCLVREHIRYAWYRGDTKRGILLMFARHCSRCLCVYRKVHLLSKRQHDRY